MSRPTMRFDDFVEMALYGDEGFYTATGAAGRRGDFITSPEVGPLFGAVLAGALDRWWYEMGEPADFRVIEVGAGPGTLARSILAAAPRCLAGAPERYVAVETSATQRNLHPPGVQSQPDLPAGRLRHAIVVANELLDNLPFRLAVFDGSWREAHVVAEGERWVEVLRPLDPTDIELPARATHGARAPLQDRGRAFVAELRDRDAARVVVFDYVTPRTAELSRRPWREWLRTFRRHERGEHYLRAPGSQDITVQVCLDQLARSVGEPDAVRSQAQFLQLWGIDDLVDAGRQAWADGAARPDLAALRGRSRVREAEALLDPHGLGGFTVVEWTF